MKKVLFFLLILVIYTQTYGALIRNTPVSITQPDGEKIDCLASGDEFFNYLHDKEGYTIIQSQIDGYYYYAEQDNDLVVPSIFRVNSVEPSLVGLAKHVFISEAEYKKRKELLVGSNPVRSRNPHFGTMNNLVVYIRFSDQTEFEDPRSFFYQKYNDSELGAFSVYNYYEEVSYNNLTIDSHHYPICDMSLNLSYQDPQPRDYYCPYNETTNPIGYVDDLEKRHREETLLHNAIDFIADEVPDTLELDADDDGIVDNVNFIIRGEHTVWMGIS